MNDARLRAEIEYFLDAHHVLSLATIVAGAPHAASLFYARDGLDLYWTSDPATRHSQPLASAAAVSATIAPDYRDFKTIRGLQIDGTAAHLTEPDKIARARDCMEARYDFLRALAGGPPTLRAAYAKAAFYVLRPSRITFIDNTKGFGHKAILGLP